MVFLRIIYSYFFARFGKQKIMYILGQNIKEDNLPNPNSIFSIMFPGRCIEGCNFPLSALRLGFSRVVEQFPYAFLH